MSLSISSVRRRMFHLLFDQNTRSGRHFEGLCGLFALLSVLIIFIESGLGTQYHLTMDEWHLFVWLEFFVTLVFTLEYLLRVFSWSNPAKYVFSFWGLSIWRLFCRCMSCGCGLKLASIMFLHGGQCAPYACCAF